jgi:xanthine dehydrogenase YagS FAD-binding subunit
VIPFDYRRADDPAGAVATVVGAPGAVYLAGGTNLVDHLKLDVARPDLVVDVTGLPFDRVEPRVDGGLRIGATVRNSDLAADPVVREHYPVLSQALLAGASGQLRNMATTGGNLLQRTRCPYFQDVTTACNKREPGSGCSAVEGYHRYHAILGASPDCVAVHPSDMAVALVALDATVRVLGRDGERDIPVADLHRLPGDRPDRDTILRHGDLITAVDLPVPLSARSAYRKVRERSSFAFALVSVAAVVDLRDGRIQDSRIAFGGVAHKPWRAHAAEDVLRDAEPSEQLFTRAADAELADAKPLPGNGFKVAMARGALVATLRRLTAPTAEGTA